MTGWVSPRRQMYKSLVFGGASDKVLMEAIEVRIQEWCVDAEQRTRRSMHRRRSNTHSHPPTSITYRKEQEQVLLLVVTVTERLMLVTLLTI